ncbi:MAG TPA: patatin-like phospholipase family protein [candidate division Zixibacteria bacterium]|nr:patatin-like phospholipase family protein [candidate division Zixibacteria bacterium]
MVPYQRQWGKVDVSQRERTGRPRIALALSGGGARGLAHIGVIRACEERGIEIAGIAGASMGGVIGGLYAVGYSTDEITDLVTAIDFGALFSNRPRRRSLLLTQRAELEQTLLTLRFNSLTPTLPTELSSAQRVTEMLTLLTLRGNYAAKENFTALPTPFKTVATDITTGEAVTLERGNLAEAMRATLAFPLAISGVDWEGRLLMDGGMLKPLPVDLARSLLDGDGVVVAVNVTKDLQHRERIDDFFEVATQVTTIMSLRELREEIAAADYYVAPDVRSFDAADFNNADQMIAAGHDAAAPLLDSLAGEWKRAQRRRLFTIQSIQPEGDTALIERLRATLLDSQSPVSETELDSALEARWREGDLLSLSARAEVTESAPPDGPRQTIALVVAATARPDSTPELILTGTPALPPGSTPYRARLRQWLTEQESLDLDELRARTESLLVDNRADLASVTECRFDRENNAITVTVDPGIARGLMVSGVGRTRFSFIRDRVHLNHGRPFSLEQVESAYRDLYSTGLFKRVAVNAQPTDTGLIVHVAVEENPGVQLRLGYHWDDEFHSEGLVEIVENNLLGIGLRAALSGRAAERRDRAVATLASDRLFRTYLAFTLESFYDELDRARFDGVGGIIGYRREERKGVSLEFGQHIARFGFVSARALVERIKTQFIAEPTTASYDIRSVKLTSRVDDLDRAHFPTSGQRSELSLESAGEILGGSEEFTRWALSFEKYIPLTHRWNLHPRFAGSTSRSNLPAPEEFFLGGLDSFEGFRRDELSGAKALLINLELRYQVFGRGYTWIKYNAGNTFRLIDDLSFDNLRDGWAAGFGLDLPVGPVIISYGRVDSSHDRVHFHAGLKF